MLIDLIIGIVCAVVAGAGVYLFCAGRLAAARTELRMREEAQADLQARLDAAGQALACAHAEKAGREAELNAERAKVEALRLQYDETLKKAEDRFKALAQTILEERAVRLQREGEKGMQNVAAGLQACIQDFRARVEKINSESVERGGRLDERITGLVDQTNAVSEQANRLAEAIRGEAQVTGEWGEMQLKRVLELGGLQETVDYTYQETFAAPGSDHRNLRTDVLVKMSDGRWMVIDAKTTMAPYADYAQAATAEEKRAACQRIIESVQNHVMEMKNAAYHRKLEQATGRKILKTMLMYIPFEDVYLLAMKAEVRIGGEKRPLRDYARENDVVFINSTGLLPVVRMLADFWSAAKANRKAMKIKAAAEALVEKVRVFLAGKDGFMEMGTQLAAVVNCYNESVKRLSTGPGNVMRKLVELKEMGVDTDALPAAEAVEAKQVEQASTTQEGVV